MFSKIVSCLYTNHDAIGTVRIMMYLLNKLDYDVTHKWAVAVNYILLV